MSRRALHGSMSDPRGARLWHPWLRINRVLRVMLHTRWSAEASRPIPWRTWQGGGAFGAFRFGIRGAFPFKTKPVQRMNIEIHEG